MKIFGPITAVVRQHVQQQLLAERCSDNWGFDCVGWDRLN